MSINNNKCGGSWPTSSPFFGGPFPTRTWTRDSLNCNITTPQNQLDMRRKAEVLLHKKNSLNITKKQKFAYLSRNPNKQITSNNKLLFSSSTFSDVPGNSILFNNTSVPLLNYLPRKYV